MSRLNTHKQALYELRFSPMCKPAGEVANLTQLESHTTRAHTLMLWRIAAGHLEWGPREVELIYESTLDSISEAFDVYSYPISRYMIDARADIWEAGLAPDCVKQAIEQIASHDPGDAPQSETLVLAGEVAQLGNNALLNVLENGLQKAGIEAAIWTVHSGATAYALGAWGTAKAQMETVSKGIADSGAKTIIADGAETAWALKKLFMELGLGLPEGVTVKLLSTALQETVTPEKKELGKVFVHDSRAAYQLAEKTANQLAIMPGYNKNEADFGEGEVYEAPRRVLDMLRVEHVFGHWTRALAKSCGADDGLFLTHPNLTAGLARLRLDYVSGLGVDLLVTDSPLCAGYLSTQVNDDDVRVAWLPELL